MADKKTVRPVQDFTPIDLEALRSAVLKTDPATLSGDPLENDPIPRGTALDKLTPKERAAVDAYNADVARDFGNITKNGVHDPALEEALAAAANVTREAMKVVYQRADSAKQTFPPSTDKPAPDVKLR